MPTQHPPTPHRRVMPESEVIAFTCGVPCTGARLPLTRVGAMTHDHPELTDDHRLQLTAWNAAGDVTTDGLCVHVQIARRALTQPTAPALLGARTLTYAELLRAAQQLTAALQARGVRPGARVGSWLRDPEANAVASLAIWNAGAALVPIDEATPAERVRLMLEDSEARLVVCDRSLAPQLPAAASVLCYEDAAEAAPLPPHAATVADPESLAYVIYTSGSTGRPKGVAVRHRNLASFVQARSDLYGPATRMLPLHSPAFDPALGGLAWTLANGGALVGADAETRRDPAALCRLIEVQRVEQLSAVPALWAALLEAARVSEAGTQLDSVRVCMLGGERLPPARAVQHYAKLPQAALYNEYGPTETTVASSAYAVPRQHVPDPLPIGRPLSNTRYYVLDEQQRLLPPGASGELYIGGAGVAAGYLNRPELTAERFLPDPFAGLSDARMYRTGDRVCWRPDGQLEFQGRLDFQVKVRGHRVELPEIEHQLERCPGVRGAAVVLHERGQLAAYYTSSDGESLPGLGAALALQLPSYMVPAYFVHLPELPLNLAGKVDRRALPEPSAELREVAVLASALEQRVAAIWSEVLDVPQLGRDDDFFALGGDSLAAMRVVARVAEQLGLRVPVRQLFENRLLHAFARALELEVSEHAEATPAHAWPAPNGPQPIAPLQATFWYLAQLEPSSTAYVVSTQFRVRGPLDAERFARALAEVIAAQDALRTRFSSEHGEPRQEVLEELGVPLEQHDLRQLALPERAAHAALSALAQRPFDLGRCPLLRCQLLRVAEAEYIVGFAVHHIVFDGWSAGLLVRQLFAAYESAAPLPRAASYARHAAQARARLRGPHVDSLLGYFREQLRDLPGPLSLTPDLPPPEPGHARSGAVVRLPLSAALRPRLRERCSALGVTHFMYHLAIFKLLVARWTGEHDVLLGSPLSVRDTSQLESVIGCFVNAVVLRTQVPELQAPFTELLQRVKTTTLGALAHAELPFDTLVAELQPPRAGRHDNPLFRLFFNDIDRRHELPTVPGLSLEPLPDEAPISKFDLTLYVHQHTDHDALELVYDPALFSAERMRELVAQHASLLEQTLHDASRPLGAYSLVTAHARPLLPDAGVALHARGGAELLQDALYRHAAERPERIALRDAQDVVSYGQLAQRVNALAAQLVRAGARPGDRVAIHAARSTGLVTALLATLEAACSFSLLDPEQPPDWNRGLLAALAPRGLLSVAEARPPQALARDARALPFHLHVSGRDCAAERVPLQRDVDAIAYVSFTSGTTGRPKGVLGTQRPVRHFLDWYVQRFALRPSDRFSLLAGIGHDPLLRDVFTPLALGAMLCIPSSAERKDPQQLPRWLREHGVSVAHITPSLGTLMGAAAADSGGLPALRVVVFGGERLRARDVALARSYAPAARLVNGYGTTETPQLAGYCELASQTDAGLPPVGVGIADTQLLIRNACDMPAGIGELGTIHVRSPYLARGYLEPAALALGGSDTYATGDRGYYDHHGRVRFAGRGDRQIKLRGHRIELPAIEAALEAQPGVARAHVLLREAADGEAALAAYVVPSSAGRPDPSALRAALRQQLTEVMVPSSWAFVEQLPLTGNGKVDAKRLLTLQPSAAVARPAYREPCCQTEEVIARLWAELFQLERVGADDDFFALGGHSLLAVRMLGVLGERLGRKVPMSLLIEHGSVGGLASALHQGGSIAEEKLVVELKTGGSRPPFWLIHPVGGHVLFARHFASLLDREQNLLGIQAQGLDGRREPLPSIEAMATHYLSLIRSYQPQGPYFIGGPSLGGKVCYEMAQQLTAAGEEVGLLVLFDTFAPGYPPTKPALGWLRDKLLQTRERGLRDSLRALKARVLGRHTPRGYVNYRAAEQLEGSHGDAVARVVAANQRASRSYQARPYPGTITLFRASQQPVWPGMDLSDVRNGWGKLAAHVEVETVDATHQSVFEKPAVQELARKLEARIARTLAAGAGARTAKLSAAGQSEPAAASAGATVATSETSHGI